MRAALSANNLLRLVGGLAEGYPDRVFGTAQGDASAGWIGKQFKALGLKPFFQEFSWDVGGELLAGKNVAAVLQGTDPKLKHEFVVITAHHDSQHDTHEGANDNGTGCAGVLALAAALAANPPRRSVLFVTFDGEEGIHKADKYHAGRRGSRYYASHPLVPLAKTALLINMDMIGQVHLESGSRNDVYQWASDDSFAQMVLRRASHRALRKTENAIDGYPEQPRESQFFSTDAEPLYRLGVPTINFLSGRDLDNHQARDDMSRVIPSRLEQYVRLAHACAVEGANHRESLSQMGIVPGGLLPSFPLIRERKSAGLHVVAEEQQRLDSLAMRLPEIKQASAQVALRVQRDFGLDDISEPTLAALRDQRDGLVNSLRRINKNDTAARQEAAKKIDTLGAIIDVLSGAIFMAKIESKGAYYLQRIPEKLADLLRGAERLGLEVELEGVVRKSDVEAFTTHVTADRAVHLARRSLGNLSRAIGQAVYAAWLPDEAAVSEPVLARSHAAALRETLVDQARGLAGALDVDDVQRTTMVHAMLDSQLSGVRGAPAQWLARFARTNVLTEFAEQVTAAGLPYRAEAKRLEAALAADDVEELEAAACAFYGAVTELAFGARFDTLEELSRLDGDRIEALTAQAIEARTKNTDDGLIQASAGDPTVARLSSLSSVVEAALSFASLYNNEGDSLKATVALPEVDERLTAVHTAAAKLEGGQAIAKEIGFWSDWLQQFLPLEAKAEEQAKARARIAQRGLMELDQLWRSVAAVRTESPKNTVERLEGRVDSDSKRERDVAALFFTAREALVILENEAEPKAEKRFTESIDKLVMLLAARARPLVAVRRQLFEMHQVDGATLGRKQRSGPLSVVALRTAQQAQEGAR